MIDALWFKQHWIRYIFWPILWPLSVLFSLVSQSRKQGYLKGKKPSYRAPIPVVVVGNITAGGNGKTPVVIWLVESLQQLGYKPGVVSRGYGGKSERYPFIVADSTDVNECGDEPKLISQRTGAPVSVSPIRSDAVKELLPLGVDVIITDDGLQHYALARDIEIVVIDGKRRFGNECLLPLGPLREPVERCNSVDYLINNGGPAQGRELEMSLAPTKAVNLLTGQQLEVSELGKLFAFAGIGHPPRFFNTLEDLGALVVDTKSFPDHKSFVLSDIQSLSDQADNVIMTEKDSVKCQSFSQSNWWYLPVSAQFNSEDASQLIRHIQEVIEQNGSSST